jgi:hypothetical protein
MPATESANAPGPEGTPSRLCLAVWCTPGFLRLAGIWANHLTSKSRTLPEVHVDYPGPPPLPAEKWRL